MDFDQWIPVALSRFVTQRKMVMVEPELYIIVFKCKSRSIFTKLETNYRYYVRTKPSYVTLKEAKF